MLYCLNDNPRVIHSAFKTLKDNNLEKGCQVPIGTALDSPDYSNPKNCSDAGGGFCFYGNSCSQCLQGTHKQQLIPGHRGIWSPVALWGSPLTYESQRNYLFKIRQNQAFIRNNTGMQVYKYLGVPLRTFTVSESHEAVSLGLHFGRSINRLMTRFIQVYGRIEYSWTEHKAKAGEVYQSHSGSIELTEGRFNRHLVIAGGDKIDKDWLEAEWQRIYKSQTSGLSLVGNTEGYAFYLAKYLMKGQEEYRRCRFSNGWIFEGWFPFSKQYKRRFGDYPSVELLSRMSENSRYEVKKLRGYPPDVKLECLFLLASEVK